MKAVVLRIKSLSASERKITAEILECIREIESQKIHFEMGYPSLLEFLVKECGYSETAALRRIDGARLLKQLPQIKEEIRSGSLNLSQMSTAAQGFRQMEKLGKSVSLETKQQVLSAIQNQSTHQTQKTVAQMLELPAFAEERARPQADESTRLEMTLSKEEMELVQKARQILGHVNPGMSWKELFVHLSKDLIKRKDPARNVQARRALSNSSSEFGLEQTSVRECDNDSTDEPHRSTDRELESPSELEREAFEKLASSSDIHSKDEADVSRVGDVNQLKTRLNRYQKTAPVSAATRRMIFQRDRYCQWKNPITGRMCQSQHLLELDHKQPRWAAGGNELANLQILCRAHNQMKYQRQAGIGRS